MSDFFVNYQIKYKTGKDRGQFQPRSRVLSAGYVSKEIIERWQKELEEIHVDTQVVIDRWYQLDQ